MDFSVSDSLLVFFNHTWALIKFLDLNKSGRLFEVGAYSRLGAY